MPPVIYISKVCFVFLALLRTVGNSCIGMGNIASFDFDFDSALKQTRNQTTDVRPVVNEQEHRVRAFWETLIG